VIRVVFCPLPVPTSRKTITAGANTREYLERIRVEIKVH
jgi:hypothetical protein